MKDISCIHENIYLVGSSSSSHSLDCNIYLIDGSPRECVLIDSGCGLDIQQLIRNIESLGLDPDIISSVVNTHCHFRHAGGNNALKKYLGYCEVIAHELDADAIEMGDARLTGAEVHNHVFHSCPVDVRIFAEANGSMRWRIAAGTTDLIPIPVNIHTPGSMMLYGLFEDKGVLFSGDFDLREISEHLFDFKLTTKQNLQEETQPIDIICAGHEVKIIG